MPRPTMNPAAARAALGVVLFLAGCPAIAADAPAITHHTEWATMRDGVLLPSEVYLPVGEQGPLPVVMLRSPYNGPDSNGCQNRCANTRFHRLIFCGQRIVAPTRGTIRAI